MSLRSFVSRLMTSIFGRCHLVQPVAATLGSGPQWWHRMVRLLFAVMLILPALWLLAAIWYQFGASHPLPWIATIGMIGLLIPLLTKKRGHLTKHPTYQTAVQRRQMDRRLLGLYVIVWVMGAGWFLSIAPKFNRDW